jgi:hypothetical protein
MVLNLKFEKISLISYTTLFKIRRYQRPFLGGLKYLALPLIERPAYM